MVFVVVVIIMIVFSIVIVVAVVFAVIIVVGVVDMIVVVGVSALDGSARCFGCVGVCSAVARLVSAMAAAVAFPDSSGIGIESAVFTGVFALVISGFFRNAESNANPEAVGSGRFRKRT